MLPGSREMQVSGPVKEDTVTGPKIAAVERREARVPDRKGTRRLSRGVNLLPKRRPALRSLAHARGKKKEAPPRASLTIGVDGARLYVGSAPSRCLICESEPSARKRSAPHAGFFCRGSTARRQTRKRRSNGSDASRSVAVRVYQRSISWPVGVWNARFCAAVNG